MNRIPLLSMVATLLGCSQPENDSLDALLQDTGDTALPEHAPVDNPVRAAIGIVRFPIGQQTDPAATGYLDPATCYHSPGSGAHKPSGGALDADDLFAIDINCKAGSEGGKSVYPVRPGTVRQIDRTGLGYVLIEHNESIVVDGVTWPKFFTIGMHMSGIPSTLVVGSSVTTNTKLGAVSSVGAGSAIHLHWVAYVGQLDATTNARLISFNPSQLGGAFATWDYTPYVWRRFVDDTSTGSYGLLEYGTSTDLYTSSVCGLRGAMEYTRTKTGTEDNRFEFKFNTTTPARGGYYFWPFVPNCNGTSAYARHRVLAGTSTTTSSQTQLSTFTVNQASIYDDYYKASKVTIESSRYLTVVVGDATGETGKKLAADQVVAFRKLDHCIGGCANASTSEQGYCLQANYATSTATTNCPYSTTVPSGY